MTFCELILKLEDTTFKIVAHFTLKYFNEETFLLENATNCHSVQKR